MNNRDKAILCDLKRFRVMRRDDICKLHFSTLKQPVKACNNVLKRLRRDGHVSAITDRNQYFYHHVEQQLKKDSAKIPHFLAILDVYLKLCEIEVPRVFDVEPKLSGKGTVEPDVFCIWKKHLSILRCSELITVQRYLKQRWTDMKLFTMKKSGKTRHGSLKIISLCFQECG